MRNIAWVLAVGLVAGVVGCGDGLAGTDTLDEGGIDVPADQGAGDVATDVADDAGRDASTDVEADATDVPGDATQYDVLDVTDTGDAALDVSEDATPPYWTDEPFENEFAGFDRGDYQPILGWILLDYNREKILADIETAAGWGVNHIQLSHDIIMDVDELLGDDQATLDRVETINQAIAAAHNHGMKVYLWAHEFQDGDIVVCYGPDGAIWDARAAAYRDAIARVPDVDGIVLMFGSAGASPWFTLCDCDWCADTFPDEMMPPPNDVKIQLVIEHIGDVLEGLDKEMVARVFAHEPDENAWHADGLARARDTGFVSMHKSEVQDWQPYNPIDPTLGRVGAHPSILEMDAAGEYFGRSELPFASPLYYRYRLKAAYDKTAIGAVARISRGSDTALGTPNEVNLLTIRRYVQNPETSIAQVWEEFIKARYLPPEIWTRDEQNALIRILEMTLPIMTKTHYVLGLWALEKGSDIPSEPVTSELGGRGDMPKWNPVWQGIWDLVKQPDLNTVWQIWVEATEAVQLAQQALDQFRNREWAMSQDDQDDLYRRLNHQYYAARAFRAVKMYIFARKSAVFYPINSALMYTWSDWAREELADVAEEMGNWGLDDVSLVNPDRIIRFLGTTADAPDTTPSYPGDPMTRPLEFLSVDATSVTVRVLACETGTYSLDYGPEFPLQAGQVAVATVSSKPAECEIHNVSVTGLTPDTRYMFKVKLEKQGEFYGGEFWVMTSTDTDVPPPGSMAH
ncbi:MAG TPA: fibronectin type III domain-containing protein [Myxococcota bacterium]|nr:fibronectin type III domain-containing protein [Myxococcota bacterium]HOH77768.1 fibronectin type III domain-containing protein [Myxococcota bacterium]